MFLIIATLILISFIFAPLGCVSLWKKYIYFGDGLAHASILAVSVSLILDLPLIYSGVIISIIFASSVFLLISVSNANAVVSLISSFMLSVALLISYIAPSRINIDDLLFGDILAVSIHDVYMLLGMLVAVLSFVYLLCDKMVLIILHRDIARIKNIHVNLIEFTFLMLLSLSIFVTIKIVGTLLVISILIIPAMIARCISKNYTMMLVNSIIISLITNLLSLMISFYVDLPITPIIIIFSSFVYIGLIFIKYANTQLSKAIFKKL